ncbi:MAG: hypothetical protein HYX92_22020 [Chloroflexi bacterium]|nr:hypothetical protein [Chloroflexota bacterium]
MYEVLSPLGESTAEALAAAPRVSDLKGKTVCEVWNGGFRGQVAFPIIRELLQKRYPGVRIVPYTEFPTEYIIGDSGQLKERVDQVVAHATQLGCDAMITGMGF